MRLAADRLSVRWFLGYGLDEALPHHSTLTRIRERYGLEVFRRFFEMIVEQCIEAGLVWGREVYFDATKVEANASLDSIKPRFAVDEHLRDLFKDDTSAKATGDEHDAQRAPEPPAQLHADVPAELGEQNAGGHDWVAEEGQPDRTVIRGSYRRLSDYRMSTTDPDASTMRTADGVLALGYQDTYVTDGGRERIILNVLVTPGDVTENQVMLDLLWRTCFRWKLWPDQVAADTTYGTIENIVPIENAGISMYTPLPDWDKRTPYFGASLFIYDPETDCYHCPDGQTLRRETAKYTEGKIVYRTDRGICNACALRAWCTSSKEGRRIHRSIDEDYLDRVRAHHQTEAHEKAMRKRKLWTEPLFAEAKLWHGMRRFRLRRLWRVNIEALMVAASQNLKRLLRWCGRGLKPASGMAVSLPLTEEKSFLSFQLTVSIWRFMQRGRDPQHFVAPVAAP